MYEFLFARQTPGPRAALLQRVTVTAPTSAAATIPTDQVGAPTQYSSALATELDCTMHPMPNAASAVKQANSHPRHGPSHGIRIPRDR